LQGIVLELNGKKIIESSGANGRLACEADALELVALCGEHDVDGLLLHASHLASKFFDLKTGLAGAVLQKLTNYRVKTALVAPPQTVSGKRFSEFVYETNQGEQFRVYPDREAAVAWLNR
jgi:PadR family transcriptional regulator, regulatory protein AphA